MPASASGVSSDSLSSGTSFSLRTMAIEFLFDLGARHRAAMITAMRRRYWLLYPAWILLCAMLFLACATARIRRAVRDGF